jgi:hypothetical protein
MKKMVPNNGNANDYNKQIVVALIEVFFFLTINRNWGYRTTISQTINGRAGISCT